MPLTRMRTETHLWCGTPLTRVPRTFNLMIKMGLKMIKINLRIMQNMAYFGSKMRQKYPGNLLQLHQKRNFKRLTATPQPSTLSKFGMCKIVEEKQEKRTTHWIFFIWSFLRMQISSARVATFVCKTTLIISCVPTIVLS